MIRKKREFEKFSVKVTHDKIYVKDNTTGKRLDLTDKYQVKQLVKLLNDYYNIIKDKWGI